MMFKDFGAGKHPSPLDKSGTQSTNQKLIEGLYRIKNITPIKSYAGLKITHVPGRAHIFDSLPAPIYKGYDTKIC